MLMLGLVREPGSEAVEGAADSALLTDAEWETWRAADDEDVRLAHACLNAEFELRARQWDALETLGAAFAAGDGATPEERIVSMPEADARRALLAAYRLGWNFAAPAEER